MSLYLKYRPQNFDDVVGQNYIVDILKAQVEKGDINSNYLFFGPRGTGKTTTARIFARALNCENLQNGSPCNECNSCKLILEGKTMDFVEIDAASHTQVDNIREQIIEKAPYPPTHLKKKIYIIDEVHMLSKAAFNALLKIMEEPPEYLTFILATTEINKVPETIVSRCQVFNFKKLHLEDIIGRLKYIAEKENIPYQDSALKLIAQLSDGALRDAVKYLEQISILGQVNEENVIKFLGVAPERKIEEFIEYFRDISGNFEKINNFIDQLQQTGIDLSVFLKQVLLYIDEKFIQDVSFFSFVSDIFKNILLNIKVYPNKALVYKIEIAKYMDEENAQLKDEKRNDIEKINISSHFIKREDASIRLVKEKNNKSIEKEGDKNIEETNDAETINKADKFDYDKIKQQLIEKLDSNTLKASLKRFADIVDIRDCHIELVVINKMQELLFKKPENIQILEQIFSEILNCEAKLYIKYISKEEYFNYQMNKK